VRHIQLLAAAAALSVCAPAWAQSDTVSGMGSAPVGRSAASVEAAAEEGARADIVRAMARRILGAERMGELTPDIVQHMAVQITPSMIVNRSADRIGKEYRVTLEARIDPAWFQGLLDNEGVISSSERAGGQSQPIFIMVDENTGAARDFQQPAVVDTEYSHSKGSAFSDKSVSAYSEKDRAAESFHGAAGSSSSGSVAGGYSGPYGSGGGAAHGRTSSAVAVNSASASSHSVAAVDKTNVQAAEHDDTHFHQTVIYQTSSHTGPAEMARPALGSSLQKYGVELAVSEVELNSFFGGKPPTYSELKANPRFKPFLASLSQHKVAPFFMGGTLTLRDAGRDVATGQPTCTGSLAATAYATADSYDIADGTSTATGSGATYEDCAAKLSQVLARLAADDLGPRIQNYWRKQMRGQARVVQAASSGPVDYTLTVRSSQMTMAMQADLMDALSAIPGVENQVFLGQNGGQVSFQVRYGGALPLQMAIYQRLRANPAFANMQPTVQGQSITLCLSGC
jgi:hypothetical protein